MLAEIPTQLQLHVEKTDQDYWGGLSAEGHRKTET